jgi:GH15 family glucan-1,4-alpha-glucosidase
MRGGYFEEAMAWRNWLLRAVAGDPADLQIMYGPAGERRLDEWEVDWLAGYEARRRCGSATPPPGSSSSTSTAR